MERRRAKLVLEREPSDSCRIFITGFKGVGYVGYIAVRHIVKSTNATRVGYLLTPTLPPFITTYSGRLALPYELYSWDKFLILLPNVTPNMLDSQRLAYTIVDFLVERNIEEAIMIGGLSRRFKQPNDKFDMRIIASSSFLLKEKSINVPFLEEGLYVVGPLAIFLSVFEVSKFPTIAILPYATIESPDPSAASRAITWLCKRYGVNIEVEELHKSAKVIRELEELEKLVYKVEERRRLGTLYM